MSIADTEFSPERLSIVHGPPLCEDADLGALTLTGYFQAIAERFAVQEALRWRNLAGQPCSWTYAQMYTESVRVARSLIAMGVGRGSRVGVLISNRPEWIFSAFGASMAGAVVVALNTFSTEAELRQQLKQADVALLIMEAAVASRDFVAAIESLCPALGASPAGLYCHGDLPFLRRVVCVDPIDELTGLQNWGDFLAAGDAVSPDMAAAAAAAADPMDSALIFFSSGSTAEPKAIMHTHRAAAMQCWRYGHWYQTGGNLRTWSANGFFWSGNFCMAFGSTFTVGGCLVLQRYFVAEETLQLLQTEKVTMAIAWPHQEARLTQCAGWQQADLSALVYVDANLILASHPSIRTDWRQPNGYGATETFTFVSGGAAREISAGSHGPVLAGNTVRIVDPDSGKPVPWGETGEIIVKGPTLTTGYLHVPPEDMLDDEGFFHTADAGHFDGEGSLVWEGRLGDMIKTGGANVSPGEVDAVLAQHPAVQAIFTVGVPDRSLGEIVVACVVVREGQQLDEEVLRTYGRRTLASYKVPRRVLFFAEEQLPMTATHKIRRGELRRLAARLLAEQS